MVNILAVHGAIGSWRNIRALVRPECPESAVSRKAKLSMTTLAQISNAKLSATYMCLMTDVPAKQYVLLD
jgi:hypothetical protein